MSDRSEAPQISPALAQAQQLLLARRADLRRTREKAGSQPACGDPTERHNTPCPRRQYSVRSNQLTVNSFLLTVKRFKLAEMVDQLPDHLGWGSAALTDHLRARARRLHKERAPKALRTAEPVRIPREPEPQPSRDGDTSVISLAPSLGQAILRHKKASAARLWLLLRHLDSDGRGFISLQQARQAFTNAESPLRFCGPRRLRGLLAEGNDIFWSNDGQRLWLRSTARTAAALDVRRFKGQQVAIPVSALIAGIGRVRAHLFAAFHSGREPAPIARQTLARISGVAARTQRKYDLLSGARRQENYVCGPRLRTAAAETMAWHHGPAAFTYSTKHAQQRRRHLAWQLPNSYNGPHTRLGRGGRKRHNRTLADLLQKGTAGNGQDLTDESHPRYFAHARAAARAAGRYETPIYWPSPKPGIWHALWQPDGRLGEIAGVQS